MLLLASFFAVLSFLVAGTKRKQKKEQSSEVNDLLNTYTQTHKKYLSLVSQINTVTEINKTSVTDALQKSLFNKTETVSDEIKQLEKEYQKIKPLYDKKKSEADEEERKKRRRRQAAAATGGFYGGSSSSSSSSGGFGGGSSWGGGGGGFSGGGASGGW